MNYSTGVVLVLAAGVFWSFIPIGVRSFEHADIWQILLYRSLGVLPFTLLLIHLLSERNAVHALRSAGISGFTGALGLVVAYSAGVAAVRLTSIANAAFLFATAPFLSAILAWLVLHEPIRRTTAVAIFIALGGISLMVADSVSSGNWIGDLMGLMSAIGFAVFTVALRAGKQRDSLPVVFLGALLTMIFAGAMAVTIGIGLQITTPELILALSLGAFVLGVGMTLCTFGSRVVPAAELALLCMTEVVFAPIWAWLFLQEVPAATVLLGGSIVVGAIVINALSGVRR